MLAIIILVSLGTILGLILGIASKFLQVETSPLIDEIKKILPGANCGQCGYVGCEQAAEALVKGVAKVSLCPPGGSSVSKELAKKLGVKNIEHKETLIAMIDEDRCIGCTKCSQNCFTDAIIGAPKMLHTVVSNMCGGCGQCVDDCPFEAISMKPPKIEIDTWHWEKPSGHL